MVFIFRSFSHCFWNKIIYSGFNKFSCLSSVFFYSNVVNDGGSHWFDEGKYWCNKISIGIWNQNPTDKLKHVVDHVKLRTYNQTASNVQVNKTFEIWKFPHPKYLTQTLKVPNMKNNLIGEIEKKLLSFKVMFLVYSFMLIIFMCLLFFNDCWFRQLTFLSCFTLALYWKRLLIDSFLFIDKGGW